MLELILRNKACGNSDVVCPKKEVGIEYFLNFYYIKLSKKFLNSISFNFLSKKGQRLSYKGCVFRVNRFPVPIRYWIIGPSGYMGVSPLYREL